MKNVDLKIITEDDQVIFEIQKEDKKIVIKLENSQKCNYTIYQEDTIMFDGGNSKIADAILEMSESLSTL
jgi:hypothetical protein